MALQIVRNNIINVSADAIVNTANPKVAVGPGVDQAARESIRPSMRQRDGIACLQTVRRSAR